MSSGEEKWALLTGASGGIGLEIARLLAQDGYSLILVARNELGLRKISDEFQSRYKVKCSVVAADLSDRSQVDEVGQRILSQGIVPEILVNNAGFGSFGEFAKLPLKTELQMVDLNISALVQLTHLFLPTMLKAKRGRILNVASTAAFQPGPYMSTYYATKAFVLSFSEALSEELRHSGVTVTTLCPGPTVSNFQKAAGMELSGLKRLKFETSEQVARIGVRALAKGQRIAVSGCVNRLMVFFVPYIPRAWLTRAIAKIQRSVDAKS
jgi:short-subunit dehydrogenase